MGHVTDSNRCIVLDSEGERASERGAHEAKRQQERTRSTRKMLVKHVEETHGRKAGGRGAE